MKIYFLSSTPCALFISGAYFGVTDLFERTAEINLRDNLYAEFMPENAHPIRFFITERLRETPPDGCEVYLMEDGIAVYAKDFQPTDLALRVIWQEKLENCLCTLFKQGHLYLSVQTQENFFNAYLPPSFVNASLEMHSGLIFLSTKTELIIFTQNGKRLLQEKVLSFTVEESALSARLPLSERLGRYADCTWALSPDTCTQTAFTICQPKPMEEEKIDDGLLAYAFFESLLIGANFDNLLCNDLLTDKDKLRAFLGDFEGVTLTNTPTRCGLIRRKAERLFSVEYYSVVIEDGKITEITTG